MLKLIATLRSGWFCDRAPERAGEAVVPGDTDLPAMDRRSCYVLGWEDDVCCGQ